MCCAATENTCRLLCKLNSLCHGRGLCFRRRSGSDRLQQIDPEVARGILFTAHTHTGRTPNDAMETPLDVLSRAATLIHDQLKSAAKGGTLPLNLEFVSTKISTMLSSCAALRNNDSKFVSPLFSR